MDVLVKERSSIRVLYSFPHKLGADRICSTAWEQVNSACAAGAEILVMPGVLQRELPPQVKVQPTLARGKIRIPYSALGRLRSLQLHDWIVARRLERLEDKVDVVHCWPAASLRTLKAANKLGIATVLERPNAHTRYAYTAVNAESKRLGIALPSSDEYFFNERILAQEEEEYQAVFRILCPSDFVVKTFREQGVPTSRLVRHFYGVDLQVYRRPASRRRRKAGLTVLFAGVCSVRKGLHFALEAWLRSPAHQDGLFLIAGSFLPNYSKKLERLLRHQSIRVLGQRNDIPQLMQESDLLILPSIEEGFGLVCTEAMASGCVPLVSEACTDICRHMKNALVHPIGRVDLLSEQLTLLHHDRALLDRLSDTAVEDVKKYTWPMAGRRLVDIYGAVSTEKNAQLCDPDWGISEEQILS
jgi:glycosyltransferase involved in cell wall biosynthesis